jgi:hypothetical protein
MAFDDAWLNRRAHVDDPEHAEQTAAGATSRWRPGDGHGSRSTAVRNEPSM